MAYNPNPPRTTGDSYIHDTVANGPPNSGDADARPPTVDISPEAKERLMKQGKSMQHDAGPDDSKSFYKGKVEGKLMHALLVTGIVEPQMPTGQLVQEFPFFRPYKQSSMRKYMNSWGDNRKNLEANKRKWNMLQVVRAHHLPCPCHSGSRLDQQPGTEQDAKPQAKTHAKADRNQIHDSLQVVLYSILTFAYRFQSCCCWLFYNTLRKLEVHLTSTATVVGILPGNQSLGSSLDREST